MATANLLWGAPRIHGEFLKLGIDVAERTVPRLMPKRRPRPSQTWRTFLDNHVLGLVSLDFFTVPTARLRVLFVLVVLAHHRRRVVHFNVTEHPTAHWTAQQIVDAFPDDSAPSYLLRDRDQVYGQQFRHRVKGMGIDEVLTAPHSPWQNPFAERLIGSIRRECLNHVLVLGERHLRRLLTRYFAYYHQARTHTSRSTRMRPTAAQLSGRNSARSSRFAKSVASTIATSAGRPDPAQSVRRDRARPSVRLLAAPPPKGGEPTDPHCWPPLCLPSPKRSLTCRESIGRRPLSGMRFWRRTTPIAEAAAWSNSAFDPRRLVSRHSIGVDKCLRPEQTKPFGRQLCISLLEAILRYAMMRIEMHTGGNGLKESTKSRALWCPLTLNLRWIVTFFYNCVRRILKASSVHPFGPLRTGRGGSFVRLALFLRYLRSSRACFDSTRFAAGAFAYEYERRPEERMCMRPSERLSARCSARRIAPIADYEIETGTLKCPRFVELLAY